MAQIDFPQIIFMCFIDGRIFLIKVGMNLRFVWCSDPKNRTSLFSDTAAITTKRILIKFLGRLELKYRTLFGCLFLSSLKLPRFTQPKFPIFIP